jgi:hypothetical protein
VARENDVIGDRAAGKAKRRADQVMVATYHQARLGDLLEHVRDGFVEYDGGRIDAFQLDEIIHHYKRAATELWKLCAVSGSQVELVARALERMRAENSEPDWWELGAARRRGRST